MYHLYLENHIKNDLELVASKLKMTNKEAAEHCINTIYKQLDSLPEYPDRNSEITEKLDLILSKMEELYIEI